MISTGAFTLGLNRWYRVEIIRVGLQGILIVDYDRKVFSGIAPGDWTNLDLRGGGLILGGHLTFEK